MTEHPDARTFDDRRADARRLWSQTALPPGAIARRVGVHPTTLRRWREREAWPARDTPEPAGKRGTVPEECRQGGCEALAAALAREADPAPHEAAALRRAVLRRLERAIGRELTAIEKLVEVVGQAAQPGAEAERAARALVALARALRELDALEADRAGPAPDALASDAPADLTADLPADLPGEDDADTAADPGPGGDDGPRTRTALRRALARRLRELRTARA